jgi:Fic family protein
MIFSFDITAPAQACAELDAWATHLDERVLPRRWSGRLRRALEAEAIAASTSMEGVPVTVADTLKILAGDPPERVAEHDRSLVLGYRDAMTFVQRRADDDQLAWNRELIVGVQDRVLAGSRAAGAGRLREGAAWIRRDGTGEVVFEPPDYEQVSPLVDELCATVASATWHPAVLAAWTHVALAAVHPFKDGNGRTARIFSTLAMYRGGFRHPAFTSLEEWWGHHPQTYYAAFDCLGRRFDRNADVSSFIATHVRAQLDQVVVLALRQHTEGRLWTMVENLLEELGLPGRLANALYDSFFDRDVTTGYYRDLVDTSAVTARNDLVTAAGAGLMVAEGRTRGRRYLAGPRLLPLLAEPLDVPPDRDAILAELVRRARHDLAPPS